MLTTKSMRQSDGAALQAPMATTLLAYDGSGSTGSNPFYHDETQRIAAKLPKGTKILFWDTAGRVITQARLAEINKRREGGGGTDPSAIADHVTATNFTGDLVIITDGQVGSIDGVAARLRSHTGFKSVIAHLINTGGVVNMSVTCPFTRSSPHKVYLYERGERRLVTDVTAEDLAVVKRIAEIGTVAEFEAAAPALEKAVVAATMGTTGDPALRDALLAMKARIMKAETRAKGQSSTVTALNAALDEKRMTDAISLARTLTVEYYGPDSEDPDAKTWSARISRFISMTEGALRSTFDLSGISAAIRGDRARRAPVAAAAPAEAAPLSEEAAAEPFECPITCDTEADVVLLVADGEPLLTGLDKDLANSLYDCPLNLLNHPALIDALKERLDHPVSLRALKEATDSGHPLETSPMTRRRVAAGAICLGAREEHCRATTWTLANLFTGGKRIGNQDLWYATIWLLVEQGAVPYLAPILPQLRAHMVWRLANHASSVSLTGVPEFPTTRVPLRTAVWYVFASAEFGMEPRRDVLRAHLPHLAALKKLLELSGLEVSEAVRAHVVRLRTMLSMLAWVKRDRHTLPNLVTALRQACVEIDPAGLRVQFESTPRFIPIDGEPTEEQIARVCALFPETGCKLSTHELIGLAALVDPSKSAGDISLPIGWVAPPARPATTNSWAYGLRVIPRSPVRICAATCRPYYHVTDGTWVTAAENHYGVPVGRLLSANEAYANFVIKYGIYPTCDELLTYLYNRRVLHGKHHTLPHQIAQFVDEIMEEHAELAATLPAAEFARRADASREIAERVRLESA